MIIYYGRLVITWKPNEWPKLFSLKYKYFFSSTIPNVINTLCFYLTNVHH